MPMHHTFGRAKVIGTAARIIGLVYSTYSALFLSVPEAIANEKTISTPNTPQCRNLKLSFKSEAADDPFTRAVASQMEKFESAVATENSEIFSQIASKALQKKPQELMKVFEGTLFEYDLKRAKLQRNSIWEMQLPDEPIPGQLLSCGDVQISPVFGPKRQVAVFYSHFSGDKQTKLLLFLAQTKLDADQPENLGIVMMQVQRWSYDGKTPEKLYTQSSVQEGQGNALIARLLADAAAKILESNPYIVSPLQAAARNRAESMSQAANAQLESLLNSSPADSSFKPERMEPIFRDGTLAIGLKFRMTTDLALNTQTKLCRTAGRVIFSKNTAWRKEFSGFECLPYAAQESMSHPPRAGSQYFSWKSLDSK